jgi:hypothetical protein
LLVSGVLPGETLSVSADVTGTGTQPLGEQPVTYVPATVNLPSYPGAYSSDGPAVSVSVKATMCENQASHASANPAQPPQGLGGFNQYVFSSPNPRRAGSGIPLLGVKVKIEIIEDLIVAEGSSPLSFQINGFSPSTEPAGPASVSWQQFGIQMQTGSSEVVSFTENWPLAYNTNNSAQNLFNLSSTNSVHLPNATTIPAGWTFDFALQYQPDGSSLINGFTCSVSDRGHLLGHLDFAYLNKTLAAGYISEFGLPSGHTTVEIGDLASLIAFQVVIVSYPSAPGSTLASGAGKITCTASSPLTPSIPWPPFSSGSSGSGEEANTTYSLVDAEPSTTIVQLFGVSS